MVSISFCGGGDEITVTIELRWLGYNGQVGPGVLGSLIVLKILWRLKWCSQRNINKNGYKLIKPKCERSPFNACFFLFSFADEAHGFRKSENKQKALDGEFYFYSVVCGFQPADQGIEVSFVLFFKFWDHNFR